MSRETNEKLNSILEKMEDAGDLHQDSSHWEADKLLIKTIKLLSNKATIAEKKKISKIIEIFNNLPKWYA